jgi:hypothetical protein
MAGRVVKVVLNFFLEAHSIANPKLSTWKKMIDSWLSPMYKQGLQLDSQKPTDSIHPVSVSYQFFGTCFKP